MTLENLNYCDSDDADIVNPTMFAYLEYISEIYYAKPDRNDA